MQASPAHLSHVKGMPKVLRMKRFTAGLASVECRMAKAPRRQAFIRTALAVSPPFVGPSSADGKNGLRTGKWLETLLMKTKAYVIMKRKYM